MPARLEAYCASLLVEWYAGRTGRTYALSEERDGDPSVFLAGGDPSLAVAVVRLYEPQSDPAAEEARAFMEERLSAGLVRGPHLLWVPPRAAVPGDEPAASDFAQRVQQAAGPLGDGARAEVELPVTLRIGKMRDEGGYASVVGGLSRWWTLITERVNGTFHVNSAEMRRAPQSAEARERIIDAIAAASRDMKVGDGMTLDAVEAWTVQRLRAEPPGHAGFAIVQAPPKIDPSDGTLMRRLVRKRMQEAGAALAGVDASIKGVGLVGVYEYAEHENVGSFVKSLNPSLFAGIPLVAAIVDGEVRPIFTPR